MTNPVPIVARRAVALYVLVVVVVITAAWAATEKLTLFPPATLATELTAPAWLAGLVRFDAIWYASVVERGYEYTAGVQSNVALFPAYPAVTWFATLVVRNAQTAGVVVGVAFGIAAVILFSAWCRERLPERGAMASVVALLLYPYSLFLAGAAYAESLFLAAAIAAFTATEKNRLWLAAGAGFVATAARPFGWAVPLTITLHHFVRRGLITSRLRFDLRARGDMRARDFIPVLGITAIPAYALAAWIATGNPLSIVTAHRDWRVGSGLDAVIKVFDWRELQGTSHALQVLLQLLIVAAALAVVPTIWRRFGPAYALFTALVLLPALLVRPTILGMSRHVLVAFPVFGVIGPAIGALGRRAAFVAAISGTLLVLNTVAYARWIWIG